MWARTEMTALPLPAPSQILLLLPKMAAHPQMHFLFCVPSLPHLPHMPVIQNGNPQLVAWGAAGSCAIWHDVLVEGGVPGFM